ncbi:hypothetical protein [Planktothrix sp.]|uniref:hypothetical protein n=1 Tax=Planktothrix sp. TaxID=3088171 RepID=UPI0038D3E81C
MQISDRPSINNSNSNLEILPRMATVHRKTGETDVNVTINLDGTGICNVSTGVPFFDVPLPSEEESLN